MLSSMVAYDSVNGFSQSYDHSLVSLKCKPLIISLGMKRGNLL